MAEQAMDIQETQKQEIDESDAERTRDRMGFIPRADIYETNEAIVVLADMPGVDEETVSITLENDVLTINGYPESRMPEGYGLAYSEYREGDFERRFTVSNQIDRDGIEATVNKGVLRLYLPKAEPTMRKIAVNAG